MSLVAGVDVGGTNIAVAAVGADHRIVERAKKKTPSKGPAAVLDTVVDLVRGLDASCEAVGVGVPGPVNDGVVKTAPNLAGWQDAVPVADRLRDALGVPVAVGNDANVGAVGEWVAGAGRGSRFLLALWLGTGVGGGLVLDGVPYVGAFGSAGEFGHTIVHRGGALCGCGRRGCVEAYAGRASLERAVAVAQSSGRATALLDIAEEKGKRRITSSVWAKALEQGDELAVDLIDTAVDALGVAVGSVINLLDLDRIVVGGGLTGKLGQPLADRIAEAARPWMLVPDAERSIVVAELPDDAGIVGAATLARELLA